MKKYIKQIIAPIIAASTLTAIITPTLYSNNVATINQNNEQQNNNVVNAHQYTTVTFCVPNGQEKKVHFQGATVQKIEVGKMFGSVPTPVPVKQGLKFKFWSEDDPGKVENPTKISLTKKIGQSGLTVYPVFADQVLLANCVGITTIEYTTLNINIGQYTGTYDSGTSSWSGANIQYTTDYGENWTTVGTNPDDYKVNLSPGTNLFIKGNNPQGLSSGSNTGEYVNFDFTSQTDHPEVQPAVNVGGNIMGLLDNGFDAVDGDKDITNIPRDYCFYHLFAEGDQVDSAHAVRYVSDTFLSSTVLTQHCYDGLFLNCAELVTAPALPATDLGTNSTNDINANTTGCYQDIFNGCKSLNRIKLSYGGTIDATFFNNWVNNVASSGEIIYQGSTTTGGSSSIPTGWNIKKLTTQINIDCTDKYYKLDPDGYEYTINHVYDLDAEVLPETASTKISWASSNTSIAIVNPETGEVRGIKPGTVNIIAQPTDGSKNIYGQWPMTFKSIDLDNCTKITNYGDGVGYFNWDYLGSGSLPKFQYSINGVDWLDSIAAIDIELQPEQTIYLKGNNPTGLSDIGGDNPNLDSHPFFTFSDYDGTASGLAKFEVGGKALGLFDDGRGEETEIPCAYSFARLFLDETYLYKVDENWLNIQGLQEGCYYEMFIGCINLIQAPNLPATTLKKSCYERMFRECKALVNPPTIDATTLADNCCCRMFYDCWALTTTPVLNAKAAAKECYFMMFQYCWQLKSIQKIALESLADKCCYQMFELYDEVTGYVPRIKAVTTTSNDYFFKCPSTSSYTSPVSNMLPNGTSTITPSKDSKYTYSYS